MAREGARGVPYAQLNLRYNPFGELTSAQRAALAVAELAPLVAHLRRPGAVLQLLADQGRGKTTHLLALQAQIPGAVYLRAYSDRLLRLPESPLWLLDELDQCWFWRRMAIWRAGRPVAFATHRDLSWELRAAGRELLTLRPSVGVELAEVLRRRVEAARRGPGALPTISAGTLSSLRAAHGDDLRAMFGALYDSFERLEAADGEV